jgi:hypothetical protein
MSPRVVLALCLLLWVPLSARATPPVVEGHLPVLEPVTVREHFSLTCQDRLENSLDGIAGEICTSGSKLHRLATRTP